MAEFNLLKLNECNAAFTGLIRENRKWLFLWATAILLLFINLGSGAISASEGRWFTIAQEMLSSGDFFHPVINGQAYYDKPLLSYWFIVLTSIFSGGIQAIQSDAAVRVTEFSARVPSAVAALVALFCVISITKRLFSSRASYYAAWVFMTMYSFVFWGRLAEADMENLAFIAAATAWYLRVREKPGLGGYALFWMICAAGAQTKGLAAFAVPGLLALADMCVNGTLMRHLKSWKAYAGLVCGIMVYSIPFALTAFDSGDYSANGFELAFRENIVRAVIPWDHKDENWYMYFRHVAQLAAPWTPFLVLAFASNIRAVVKRTAKREDIWVLVSIVAIFTLFALSRSRRVYYIMPILPFCAILTGVWLERAAKNDIFEKAGDWLMIILDYAIPVISFVLLCSYFIFRGVYPRFAGAGISETPEWFYGVFYFLLPLCGFALALFWFFSRKRGLPRTERIFAFAAFALFMGLSVISAKISGDNAFRSERDFCFTAHDFLFKTKNVPERNIVFWMGDYSNLTFYLDLPRPAAMYSVKGVNNDTRSFFSDTVTQGDLEDFRAAIEKLKREGGGVITRRDRLSRLPDDLRFELEGACVLQQDMVITEYSGLKPSKISSVTRKKHILCFFPRPDENE